MPILTFTDSKQLQDRKNKKHNWELSRSTLNYVFNPEENLQVIFKQFQSKPFSPKIPYEEILKMVKILYEFLIGIIKEHFNTKGKHFFYYLRSNKLHSKKIDEMGSSFR